MNTDLNQLYERLLDEMGPQDWWPAKTRFEVILGAILTQNTNWKNVEKVISALEKQNLITPKALDEIELETLANLIRPAGYFNQKAKKIKAFLEYFKKYDFDLDAMSKIDTEILREELLSVWGIGPETADAILLYALEKPVFVVDAYTRRSFSRIGGVDKVISYEDLREFFEKKLEPDVGMFKEFHALIDELAKQYCTQKPKCGVCPLMNLCNYFENNSIQ